MKQNMIQIRGQAMPEEAQPKRAKRSDAGVIRQTGRDAELMEWMAQMYGIPMDLLQHHLGVGQVTTYQLVQRWLKANWAKRGRVDAGPAWVWPMKATANQALGWDAREWTPKPTISAHTRAVAAVRLHRLGFDLTRWKSERMLWHEHGWRLKDEEYPHMPDGVETLESGKKALIEVELTAKTRTRYISKANEANNTIGLLSDVTDRARDLECSVIAYWCAPKVLPVIKEVTDEYQRRREARLMKRGQPELLAHEPSWHVKSLEEVPGWQSVR
ncbi:hypothetical protein [Pseudonocardia sp. ICBG601]|uniref:hypothetical protein n=1 Tax=Pseudonocardia sp. ICBG601 TaxID=2846759 RepID=UPI001CF6E4B8|nr:hypothetical protein [Pseudonocardia sp. ICBG601]